jgi:hypothetical protein
MTYQEAQEKVEQMSLEDLIKLWNDVVANTEDYMHAIHEMKDDSWWNELFRKNAKACRMLVRDLYDSTGFYISDKYFFYDDNECYFESFSTKERLLDKNKSFFVEVIMQRHS